MMNGGGQKATIANNMIDDRVDYSISKDSTRYRKAGDGIPKPVRRTNTELVSYDSIEQLKLKIDAIPETEMSSIYPVRQEFSIMARKR